MNKNILTFLTAAVMTCSAIPALNVSAAESGTCGENLTWTLDDSGTLTISGTGNMTDYVGMASPFYERSDIHTVIIEQGVQSLGYGAFYLCENLTQVIIPDTVSYFGGRVFGETPWLEAKRAENPFVTVDGILIDGAACEVAANIPDSVEYIGDAAFASCDSLTDITIPEGIRSIGRWAFSYCDQLTAETIPSSVSKIGKPAFGDEESVTIKGYVKSEAERHARLYGIKFQSLGLWKDDLNGNGKVEIDDAQTVLNIYVDGLSGMKSTLTTEQNKAADVSGDNEVSIDDAQFILNYYVLNTVFDIPTAWGKLLANKY